MDETQKRAHEEITSESKSIQEEEGNSESKEKDIYFIILVSSEEKIDFKKLKFVAGITPSNIYDKYIDKGNGNQLEEIVFKIKKKGKKNKKKEKGEKEYSLKFISGEHTYTISFDTHKKSFIYSPDFDLGHVYLDNIFAEPKEQNIIPYYNKLDIFLEALDKNNESKMKEKLFEDSIDLYEDKKIFSLLIKLFLKMYDKNKELCKKLLEIFYENNDKENKDRDNDLKKELKDINDIYSNAKEIINKNGYKPIYFYGILFCYLHYYNKEKFPSLIIKFSEGNSDILYEILIKYNSHFMHPLCQKKEFYDSFIKYVLNRNNKQEEESDLEIFEKVMRYIKDIETYLYVINENKEKIFKKYKELKSEPINLDSSLKLNKFNIEIGITLDNKNEINNEIEELEEDKNKKSFKNECDIIIDLIEKLIDFSKKERILSIYMESNFWIYLIKEYDIADIANINNLYNLRTLYKKYNGLINDLSEQNVEDKKNNNKLNADIKDDINRYLERDEFAFILNKNINDYFKKNKGEINNVEILGIIAKYNPYFSIKDEADKERFKLKRDTIIFDYIDFRNTKELFNKNFRNFNFEIMFQENISDYINKITGKIIDIQTFGNIIKLIDETRIKKEKQNYYFIKLKEKYKSIIEKDIKLIKGDEELNKAIEIISELVSKLFIYYKNNNFIKDVIKDLNDKIKSLIYIELLTKYNGKDYELQKDFIYNIYLDNMETKEGREDIINLIKKLSGDEKKIFMFQKLLKKCEFTKEEFFLDQENYKIKILCILNKEINYEDRNKGNKEDKKENEKYLNLNKLSKEGNTSAKYLISTLDEINLNLEKGKINKKDLERFLKIRRINKSKKDEENARKKPEEKGKNSENNNETEEVNKEVVEKLSLISLLLNKYNPDIKYREYKKTIDDINEKLDKLIYIKDSLMIFHKTQFFNVINDITKLINEIENKAIINFKSEDMKEAIKEFEKYDELCRNINLVKDFLLFKKIFEKSQGKDQLARFNDATKKLSVLKQNFNKNNSNIEIIFDNDEFKNIFKSIKDELGKKDELTSKLFLEQMIEYFEIKNEKVIKDLVFLIKSKKYEMIIKSIKYFFDHFSDRKLYLPNNINLSELKLESVKSTLENLKNLEIYDYKSNNPYHRVFAAFYENEEAIDFLKNNKNVKEKELSNKLKGNLDPTNRSISIKDIDDTIECLNHFKDLMNKTPKEIINYFKLLSEENIKKFESYSKKYGSIKELDSKTGKDNFEDIYEIINDATLVFNLDDEYFTYKTNDGNKKQIKDMEELIKLKSKINLQSKENKEKEKKEEGKDNDIYETKCHKLLFFKDIISNLEIIYDKINILRTKGFNIPISIIAKIQYDKVSYLLNQKEKDINEIKSYLFTINNDYENQLSSFLKTNKYLRLLYGKLFRKIRQHQEGNFEIPEMKRYLFNKTSVHDIIKKAENIKNVTLGEDETQYKLYTKEIFDSISAYLVSLFQTNNSDFDKHYKEMEIKVKNKKGISIYKCINESIEEFILFLFETNLNKLPIAQNIIICSKETSIEELQSFLYRAILCEYNTLFVLEILESFSNFQLNKMYGFIDTILSIKLEKYMKKNENNENKNINKEKSSIYLDSYIVFVYKNIEEKEAAFKNELKKYSENPEKELKHVICSLGDKSLNDNEDKDENETLELSNISMISMKNIQENERFKNILVVTSDVCGLGKSFKIAKLIDENNKIRYHLSLGGKLTKNKICQKIESLFEKIKKDSEKQLKVSNKNRDKNLEDFSEFNNVAIHLDLIETKEVSLINEFLFSFLITKFYNNNENIIYIPDNIDIYVEVPNSSENYLKKFGILKVFNVKNIELGELENLQLDEKIREKFEKLNNKKENDEIQDFIKKNFEKIGIYEYSYHQVNTFIKLYLNLFDSQYGDVTITDECIDYFVESSQYFINRGFSDLIMKKLYNKDSLENAYKNDLGNNNFDIPLIYIDNKTKEFKLEYLPFINQNEKKKVIKKKIENVDIVYVIDGTGSMYREIDAAKKSVIQIFNKLTKTYKDYKFQFGAVFYRDKVHQITDRDEYFQFTDNMKNLEENIGKIQAYGGGGDGPEDWVGGYNIALNKMEWRDGIKLIIHIADSGAHGTEFSTGDLHPDEGKKLIDLIKECVEKNINIIGFKVKYHGKDEAKQSFDKMQEIYNDYKKKKKDLDNGQFIEIYDFERGKADAVSNNFQKLVVKAANQVINPSYKYLERLKKILNLENDLEDDLEDDKHKKKKSLISILSGDNINYVITDDNYKKMVLLVYRIKANVPVIIMGETGCGKTSLIKKLSQILNNGEELVQTFNINPGITDEQIIDKMKEMNLESKKEKYKNKELWVFFDEINTCLSLSLLTEIFINRTFNGEKLEDNIRLIGACNPYRFRPENIERFGLTRDDDEDDQLVYKVEKLPESLLFYVFSFGPLKDEDEKKYIHSIIQKLFTEEEEKLHNSTTEAISECHIFLRDSFGNDHSVVSLREINRFTKCVEFFMDYFNKKNKFIQMNIKNKNSNILMENESQKKLSKIKSIICSIYLIYYIRLTNDDKRSNFESRLQNKLLDIVNVNYPENKDNQKGNLFSKIMYNDLKQDLSEVTFTKFSDLLKIEENFLLEQIDLDEGIGKNQLLKENIFMLFLAVVTKIPLIIVGKPGTGKSLSAQLIYNSMRGKYSKQKGDKKNFFLNYPQINQIYFQGSKSSTPEDVEQLFKKADDMYKNYCQNNKHKQDLIPIYMILFDELGLAEKAPTNPLKVIHSKLEYNGKTEGTCFIGISNYSLDAAKVNRALSLSVPNLEDKPDQLKLTSQSIIESIPRESYQDNLIFNILSRAYYEYKKILIFIKQLTVLKKYFKEKDKKKLEKKNFEEITGDPEFIKLFKRDKIIKTEFHGNRDFYNIIRGVAIESSTLKKGSDKSDIITIINNFIERNFGGISYNIDIDFTSQFEDKKAEMEKLQKEILKEKLNSSGRGKQKNVDNIKVTSVFLFKKIFNEACILESNDKNDGKIYQIREVDLLKYDINKCINDNINDNNSRYLLLEIKQNLSPLIIQNIKLQNSYREGIDVVNGSPFSDDNNKDYKAQKVGEIQNWASMKDKLIILLNLEQVQAYLYDLYNMNYKIIDDQKFVRICLDNYSEQLTPVNDTFKIIVLVDKKFVNKVDMAFLNRLEKIQISFEDLLSEKENELITKINGEIRLQKLIEEESEKFNYDLDSLLINFNKEEIGGLVYYLFLEAGNKVKEITKETKEGIKNKIYSKMSILLPEDIVLILESTNPLYKNYFDNKKYYNFKLYFNDLKAKKKTNFKISIIYTFSNITNSINDFNNDDAFMINEISSEEKLKTKIEDIKNKTKGDYILIRFEDFNSKKIQFTADYIKNYLKKDNLHYIFIIYLNRNFNPEEKESQIINSIPNIYDDINQLFIDNLEGPDIKLDLLDKNVKDILFSEEAFPDLDKEFKESLIDFLYDKYPNKNKEAQKSQILDLTLSLDISYGDKKETRDSKIKKYLDEIINYMDADIYFKNEIIKKAKELIESDEKAEKKCKNLVDEMLESGYMNENKIDIISSILDYIKENVFKKYVKYLFGVLEDNNFLTTLLEINKNKFCRLDKNDKSEPVDNRQIIKELQATFLKEIKYEKENKYEPKFLSNYNIPGFYNFYKNLSNYLTEEINSLYFDNENKIRKFNINENSNDDEEEKPSYITEIEIFHEEEEKLLQKVLTKLKTDELYYNLINRIEPDLILKDYIVYYLEKYTGYFDNSYYNIINKLLFLKFSDEINIIKNNNNNPVNIVLIKIMWIESNVYFIEDIFKVFKYGKNIVNDQDGILFFNMIVDSIDNPKIPIKYITNKIRPDYKKEVNECFYIFLAGFCLTITTNEMDKMVISIGDYCGILIEIAKIIDNLNDSLGTYLNEFYIIDELIQIIKCNPNAGKPLIEDIRYCLTDNTKIIQENNISKLTENFIKMNKLLIKIKNNETENKYYATLKYIYKKEIEKVNDRFYCAIILCEIIKEKELIKISNDIFQKLLIGDIKKLNDIKNNFMSNSEDNIIKNLNEKLSDDTNDIYLALSETLLYLFEKISLISLKDSNLDDEQNEEEEEDDDDDDEESFKALEFFKECIQFLNDLNNSPKNAFITKLFCIGYIKSFCYTFINKHDEKEFNPENIIKVINEKDIKNNMIKLYIYKIIFNKYNRQINIFINRSIIDKYKLENYNDFENFINKTEIENLEQFSYKSEESNYEDIYTNLEKLGKNKFSDEITEKNISKKEELDFDGFYMASYKLILSNLNKDYFKDDISYTNFYKNVCEPLFGKNKKLIKLMQLFFEKEKYLEIKKEFNSKEIEALLYGYRYCLNEVKDEEQDYIYSYLYNINNTDFNEYFYPGYDNKEESYYELYNKIINHFKETPDEGCFVCLCNKGYYHSVKLGFPGYSEINMKCPKCLKEIGAKEIYDKEIDQNNPDKIKYIKAYHIIKSNNNYFRIFKDDEEIRNLKLDKDNNKMFENLKYMTLKTFEEEYILTLYEKEKGLNEIHRDNFLKDNKIIRNLSQISYRLLNYILYCHLFFAKIFTGSVKYDKYLPKGMTWPTVIKECLNKLKSQLALKDINNIEIFMNCVFKDLFEKLHNQHCIKNHKDLIEFEDNLEKLIQGKCEETKNIINEYKISEKEKYKDPKSSFALLKELYDKYEKSEFPYYDYFYFTDYLNEKYIKNIIKNEYPVLRKYLSYEEQKESKDIYSLDNLNLFNNVLNLFYDKYSNQISRENSEKETVKQSDIYKDKANENSIKKFIKKYNKFKYKDDFDNILKLTLENKICDFFLIDDNKYGNSYKKIYKIFIDKQNKELESLLNEKISLGEFNYNCKNRINIQQIKKNEIFTLHENSDFIKILFDSSYRKYIDTHNKENYNEYVVNLKQIEEEMTNLFLKNKKLLNDNIIGFNFNNEVFSIELNDEISNFKYKSIDINIEDKAIIYEFIKKNDGNNKKYKEIINNFITLIDYLNSKKNENNEKNEKNDINEDTDICNIEIVKNLDNISEDFKNIFSYEKQKKDGEEIVLKVNKLISLFHYYLKLIFNYVKIDIENHLEEKSLCKRKDGTAYYFDEKLINSLEEILKNNKIIKKENLASAIRLFITLVLFREEDDNKDKKIKSNKKNIVDYLKSNDLWESDLYINKTIFEEELLKFKKLNIKIKEILYFYYDLINNKDEEFEKGVKEYIEEKKKREEKANEPQKVIGEDDDISDSEDSEKKKKEKKKKTKKKGKKKKKPKIKKSDESDEESGED